MDQRLLRPKKSVRKYIKVNSFIGGIFKLDLGVIARGVVVKQDRYGVAS